MPKKRHQSRFSKPQSTAPASLGSTTSTSRSITGRLSQLGSLFSSRATGRNNDNSRDEPDHNRSVNQLLANLRRTGLRDETHQQAADRVQAAIAPSVPPAIRDILQPPGTPVPRPHAHVDPRRRLPPGPAPPNSWLRESRHALRDDIYAFPEIAERRRNQATNLVEHRPLPGAYLPRPGSLIAIVLRHLAREWDSQMKYCRYWLYQLPTHLRSALIVHLDLWYSHRVSLSDLQAILLPPPPLPVDHLEEGEEYDDEEPEDVSVVNADFTHLDLAGCLGIDRLKVRELQDLLFPPRREDASQKPQESWDDAVETGTGTVGGSSGGGGGGGGGGSVVPSSIPGAILANLTHLSLALDPAHPSFIPYVSWRHLLRLSPHLSRLTHLSLAYWPPPVLTTHASYARMVLQEGYSTVQFDDVSYKISPNNEWAEPVMVLSRFSRNCYGLEYLDLTGCGGWWHALTASAQHDRVDWVGHWGKITTLMLYPGRAADSEDMTRYLAANMAMRVERHIRAKRAGQGRFITVETGLEMEGEGS